MTYAHDMDGYISTRGRATAIRILTIVQLVVLGIELVLGTIGLADLGHGGLALTVSGGLEIFEGLLFLAAGIVYLTWVYRAVANLPALGSMNVRFTPAGAVWGHIIPFLNLVRGHQVMSTIWRESQPPAIGENGFYLPRSASIVSWWWGLFLAMTLGDRVIAAWSKTLSGIEDVRAFLTFALAVDVVTMVAGALFLVMIGRTQKRQDEQWQDLMRQRGVPQPTADALR